MRDFGTLHEWIHKYYSSKEKRFYIYCRENSFTTITGLEETLQMKRDEAIRLKGKLLATGAFNQYASYWKITREYKTWILDHIIMPETAQREKTRPKSELEKKQEELEQKQQAFNQGSWKERIKLLSEESKELEESTKNKKIKK